MKRNSLFVSCAILSLVTAPLFAGPKGTVQVRPIESGSVTIDGKFDDWNLNSYTTVARQPLYPDALGLGGLLRMCPSESHTSEKILES